MLCPRCGRYIPPESTVCHHCGNHMRSGSRLMKVVAICVIAVVGLFLFNEIGYQTESADSLLKAAGKEMEKANKNLQDVETQLNAFNEVQFESDSPSIQREYALQSRERALTLFPLLDDALHSCARAKRFIEKCDGLRLPATCRSRVSAEKERAETYEEYALTLKTLASDYVTYYEFAESYFSGEQLFLGVMSSMDRGNLHLEAGDYTFAVAAYESALEQLKKTREEYTVCSKVINVSYMGTFLTNMNHLENALLTLSEAARQLDQGNTEYANSLALLGTKEVESVIHTDKAQLKAQIAQWYALNIGKEWKRIEKLKNEIEELKKNR